MEGLVLQRLHRPGTAGSQAWGQWLGGWVRPGHWGLPLAQVLEAQSAGSPEAKIRRSTDPGLLFLIKIIT